LDADNWIAAGYGCAINTFLSASGLGLLSCRRIL